jgi:hypothetical protein
MARSHVRCVHKGAIEPPALRFVLPMREPLERS